VLEAMLDRSSFAVLVMTAEDEDAAGKMHSRPNVIHETGLFQGRLGFTKAMVLLEEGTSEFSNIHGINQVRFARGQIASTFGEVLATLRREFEPPYDRAPAVASYSALPDPMLARSGQQ